MMRDRRLAALAFVLFVVPSARAIVIGGGGSSRTDCLAVFDSAVNYPPDNPKRFRCKDGDPCDACPSCVSIREGRAMDLIESGVRVGAARGTA